jgi:hypothetical protein
MIERKEKKNMRNRERGKILTALLAVMLILVCIPAGMAFAASATATPVLSQSNGATITTSTLVSIGNITAGDTAYYTITTSSTGTMPTTGNTAYLTPFIVSASAGTFTVDAAVYDSINGWSDPATATFTVSSSSSSGNSGGAPSVQTESAASVTATSAVLNGDVTSNNGYTVTDYGFLWGTNASSLTNKLDVGTTNNNGAFTDTLSGLTANTTYYFEAYATNSYGTADGSVISITTAAGSSTTTTTTTATNTFSDVPTSFWGYYAISSLSGKGIVSGYPVGTFQPNASITRAEFASMLAKALVLNTSVTTGTFTDVTAGDWYYGSVNAAASAGLVSGMGDNLFAPNALITREQMAVMVAKALGTKAPAVNGTELNAFSDSSTVDSWAVTSMKEAIKAGIISGMTANTLAPLADATRAQAAVMIYHMLTVYV